MQRMLAKKRFEFRQSWSHPYFFSVFVCFLCFFSNGAGKSVQLCPLQDPVRRKQIHRMHEVPPMKISHDLTDLGQPFQEAEGKLLQA